MISYLSFTFSRYLIEKTFGGPSGPSEEPGPTTAPGVPGFNEINESLAPNAPTISVPTLPSTTGANAGFGINQNLAPGVPSTSAGQQVSPLPENVARASNQVTPTQPYNKAAGTGALLENTSQIA